MTTSEKIKELRIKNNMTQEELRNKLGVGKAAVHKWENGIVVNLKRSVIANLANVLGCRPSYLFDDETIKPADSEDGRLLELLKRPEIRDICDKLAGLSPEAFDIAGEQLSLLLKLQDLKKK